MCTENRTPHVHAKEIKEWADGATIQYEYQPGIWHDSHDNRPTWVSCTKYRVKPKEDVVMSMSGNNFRKHCLFKNVGWKDDIQRIEVTFDGETGLLKSARLIPL